jgi:hypothetical protein
LNDFEIRLAARIGGADASAACDIDELSPGKRPVPPGSASVIDDVKVFMIYVKVYMAHHSCSLVT